MAVVITPSVLRQQVEEGWKMQALAEHYGLPVSQMRRALKAQNLTIRKFRKPAFVFAEETEAGTSDVIMGEEINHVVETEETVEEKVETPIEETDSTTEQPTVPQMGNW